MPTDLAPPHPPHDAYPPREIARKVERAGVAKAQTDALTLLVAGVYWIAYLRGERIRDVPPP